MNMASTGVGFFGKLPSLGDFVNRRLPRQFIDRWDQWLQSSVRLSQEVHGEQWLSLFLVSPFWRFAISPGVCGEQGWAGVMMPSVDRVGRYYPLTLAQAIEPAQMTEIFLADSAWFNRLESAALSVLEEPFDFEAFELSLLDIPAPEQAGVQCVTQHNPQSAKNAFSCQLQSLEQSSRIFPSLAQGLLGRFMPGYSFWACEHPQQGKARFFCFEGMPPIDAYADFLRCVTRHEAEFCPLPATSQATEQHHQPGNEPTLPKEKLAEMGLTAGQWQSHGISVVGNRRKHNEDALLDAPNLCLWVVADGMGGHQSGDVASRRIVDELASMPANLDLAQREEWVCHRLQHINQDLCQLATQMHMGAVVGSTVVVVLADGKQCVAIWAGDSRLYRLRGDRFEQLTHDHTLVDELVTSGNFKREEAIQQVGANVITRAVGGQEELELDVIHFQAEAGDRYLLCSDGLDKELTETDIAAGMHAADCRSLVQGLIDQALAGNAIDNITVIAIEYSAS